ncbi:MAG: cation:proton antiporter [Acidobacteria bacterium]|nr:cation:proton antiporter [Acidobacteriota bacterium]
MRKVLLMVWVSCLAPLFLTQAALADSGGNTANDGAHGLDPTALVGIAVLLMIAKLGGELFERLKQPAVLGELIGGIIVGNLALVGFMGFEPFKANAVIGALAEIGVIILLFEVGLESNVREMLEVGWSSLLVAVAGVIAPFFLGWGVAAYFLPEEATLGHIFIGATLCATSVGITARVIKDLGRLQARESRIILGAAVIDDVLGLLILAVVAGAIKAAGAGTTLSLLGVALIAFKAVVFMIGAVAAGRYITPRLFHHAGKWEVRGMLLALAISFCFLLAWLAALVGLAPIVGAFAAGLVLDAAQYESFRSKGEKRLEELIQPVSQLLVPLFFVLMGLKVDLRAFARLDLLMFALMLTIAAIIGKQVCSLAVVEKGINRFAVGLGMIPRGEVGLIFAGIGASLMLPNAQGVSEPIINAATFGVVVIMVVVTTLMTPPALKWAMGNDVQTAKQSREGEWI